MTPHDALEKHFGFREFLDAQEEVIDAILAGNDVLCVMPTGGGKSLCYQLPALMLEGVTVVVSPLIALMKDQVDALARRGIDATLINSTLSPEEQRERIRRLAAGEFKMVYIAPERFRSPAFVSALGRATISLFAVDEAHCISQWGHDFRPDYFRLHEALERLGHPQVAAFTATATPEVRNDILARLQLEEPRVFVSGFARPNLKIAVIAVDGEAAKYERLRALLKEHRTGIVYCATRKRVEAGLGRAGRMGRELHRLPWRARRRRARGGAKQIHPARVRRGGGHQRLRHGHRSRRHPLRGALRDPGQRGGVLPGGRARGPRRRAGAMRAVSSITPTRACRNSSSRAGTRRWS